MKALIIDDSVIIGKVLREVLMSSFDFNYVVHKLDGNSGLSEITKDQIEFDLVFLDWKMKGLDGIEVLKRIRGQGCNIPVIMCTMESDKESIVTAINAGADEYLTKPFNKETLKEKIQSVRNLKRKRAKTALQKRILVVDDSVVPRKILQEICHKVDSSLELHFAHNGKEALLLKKHLEFDLIFLDWEMPGIKGVEVLKKIREADTHTPIYMATSNTSPEHMVEAFDAGASYFAPKPFQEKELMEQINCSLRQFDHPATC